MAVVWPTCFQNDPWVPESIAGYTPVYVRENLLGYTPSLLVYVCVINGQFPALSRRQFDASPLYHYHIIDLQVDNNIWPPLPPSSLLVHYHHYQHYLDGSLPLLSKVHSTKLRAQPCDSPLGPDVTWTLIRWEVSPISWRRQRTNSAVPITIPNVTAWLIISDRGSYP